MGKVYLCIDLKTFFASVECVERGLDPFKTDLVVADPSRCRGAICLAISPRMKERGIKNRCRVYEIPKNVHPIVAKPRMKKYIEYSAKIYGIYLKFIDKRDIHVYSIDEAFLDITSYLKLYKKNPFEIAKMIMNQILDETGITATAGIGTNLYLTKIALDIIAKHKKDNIGYLDENIYKETLWHHTPLTDFWQIGSGIENRLHNLHLKDMYDVAHCDEKKLYKEFGKNAEFLIDHAWGRENCTISMIKSYKTKSQSISNGQILYKDYNYENARKVLTEMTDQLTLQLVSKNLYTDIVGFCICYSKNVIPPLKVSKKLNNPTNSYREILNFILNEYDFRINENYMIRRINIWFSDVSNKKIEQLDLFTNKTENDKDEYLENTINSIKSKYGKNSILRAISYDENATQRARNKLIGGHNAE